MRFGQHHRRIGPFASGAGESSKRTPPPALRRVGVREILYAPLVSGQVGYPLSMNTDACLGFSAMGYQSSDLTFTSRDDNRGFLARYVGHFSKGRSGAKKELAQRAKVGYRPCCAAVTHVAAPPSFVLASLEAIQA